MSSTNEKDQEIEELTNDLRSDFDPVPVASQEQRAATPKPFVKPTVHASVPNPDELTPGMAAAFAKLAQQAAQAAIAEAKFDSRAEAQAIRRGAVPVTDFSAMSISDVYDLSIPIEAKPFMSADVLEIKLKDTNYEPRWVNKNPQRLGSMIAKGFTYIQSEDLVSADGIKTGLDAEGHFVYDDVVAMKIDKATYYRALRAAHERAVATTDQSNSRKRAARIAAGAMQQSEFSNDYNTAATNKTMEFYDPGIQA
jgi:hypothetical protein